MRGEKNVAEAHDMNTQPVNPEYLGALITSEQRLVLVPMDPKEPWAAFRRMRTWMQQADKAESKPELGVFASPKKLESNAKVIPLRKRA